MRGAGMYYRDNYVWGRVGYSPYVEVRCGRYQMQDVAVREIAPDYMFEFMGHSGEPTMPNPVVANWYYTGGTPPDGTPATVTLTWQALMRCED